MQSVNGEPGSFRGDPAAGRAGFEITKRVLFLAFLIGTMLIPLYMIRGLVEERFGLSQNVAAAIAGLWGGPQLVAGPVVTIPYISRKETVVNGAAVWRRRSATPSSCPTAFPSPPRPRPRSATRASMRCWSMAPRSI